jgi:hypothetical protein
VSLDFSHNRAVRLIISRLGGFRRHVLMISGLIRVLAVAIR